jgi:tetratricopeptide (TPR) repeat protein
VDYVKQPRDKVFISYSHKDKKWLNELQVHLSPVTRTGKVDVWDDNKIGIGTRWRNEIETALNFAKVVVLLLSGNFLSSTFISEYELPAALTAMETEGVFIVPVVLRPFKCRDDDNTLSEFQSVNPPDKTLSEMEIPERDRCWIKVVDEILADLKLPLKVPAAKPSSISDLQPSASQEPALPKLDSIPAVGVFFDREKPLSEVRKFVDEKAHRLVVLSGPYGVGKTRLAAKFAEEEKNRFKSVFWITCKPDQASLDVLFGKLDSFLEQNGESALRGLWKDARPDQLQARTEALLRALMLNPYLLVFDEFENWLDSQFQINNPEIRDVLSELFCYDHQSKVMIVSDRKVLLDPAIFKLPFGCKMERKLEGLDKLNSLKFLEEEGLKVGPDGLLDEVITHFDGNPYMMQIYSYLVTDLNRDPKEALTSGEPEMRFAALLNEATRDLNKECLDALELLSVLRTPLMRNQVSTLGLRFDFTVGPLINRFLVDEDTQGNLKVPATIRSYVEKEIVSDAAKGSLHFRAAEFYKKLRAGKVPETFEEAQLYVEEAFHRFQADDAAAGVRIIVSAAPLLIDWGYVEMAENSITEALSRVADERSKAMCLWLLGAIADLRNNYPQAMQCFEQALRLFEKNLDYTGMCKSLFRIGRINNANRCFEEADKCFERCIEICKEQQINDEYAASLLEMGWNRKERSHDVDKVLDLYDQSVILAEKTNDFETLSTSHRQIGFLLWIKRKEKDKAKQHYEQAAEISQTHNLAKEIGAVYSEFGYLYGQWGEPDKAEENSRKAIEIFNGLGNRRGLCNAYANLGKALELKGNFADAVLCYNQSRSISTNVNDVGCEAYVCRHLGGLLLKQKKFAEAEAILLKAKRLSSENGLPEILKQVEEELKRIEEQSGQG